MLPLMIHNILDAGPDYFDKTSARPGLVNLRCKSFISAQLKQFTR